MKKLSKIAVLIAAAVLMCLTLVGCGEINIDDIKGDWTLDSVNGQSVADYAASLGLDASQAVTNLTIKDDKTMTSTNINGTEEFDIELKANGFEVRMKGKSEVFMSVEYDKDAGTLTYSIQDAEGNKVKQVFKKGTAEIGSAPSVDQNASDPGDTNDDQAATDDSATDDSATDEGATDDSASDDSASDDMSEDDAGEEQ